VPYLRRVLQALVLCLSQPEHAVYPTFCVTEVFFTDRDTCLVAIDSPYLKWTV
jgi:hypothetical protein